MGYQLIRVFGSPIAIPCFLVIRECMHFFTLAEIRLWDGRLNHREHIGSQRAVIFIFQPLCVTLWFFENLISKISKNLRGFGHRNARYKRPEK